ncbi:hypothetical protein [Chishuiella changwenlii]|uniref:hypothetical protein n=1 Tax=Chishuiella changwenlii TaxID=1434701 RepID=UPI002FD94058
MINKLITLFSIIILVSCFTNTSKNKSLPEYYMIENIDSINNYYIIRAVRNDSVFNIISKKEKNINCKNKIFKKRKYNLNLHSVFKDVQPAILKNNLYQLTYWSIDDSLSIKLDSIENYYTTKNIIGICNVK